MTPPPPHAPKNEETTRHTDIQENWQQHAACKGSTHLMFPREHKDITYIPVARAICAKCPVRTQCLDHALTYPAGDMHGVWAGFTPRQLAQEQLKRGITPTVPTLAQMWGDLH